MTEDVCSHCDARWTEDSKTYNGGSCDEDQANAPHDKEIWRSDNEGEARTISIGVNQGITICISGLCVTMPVKDLHELAVAQVEDDIVEKAWRYDQLSK